MSDMDPHFAHVAAVHASNNKPPKPTKGVRPQTVPNEFIYTPYPRKGK